jgi:hypothetical protein
LLSVESIARTACTAPPSIFFIIIADADVTEVSDGARSIGFADGASACAGRSNWRVIGRACALTSASTSSCAAPRTALSATATSRSPTRTPPFSAWPPGPIEATTFSCVRPRPSGPAAKTASMRAASDAIRAAGRLS